MDRICIMMLVACFSFCSCSSKLSSGPLQGAEDWEVVQLNKDGERLSVEVKNSSATDLRLFNPLEKRIEHRSDSAWVTLKTPYCDCASPCPSPPESFDVEPDGFFSFSWDLRTKDCEMKDGQSRTVAQKAGPGEYRITFYYSTLDSRAKKKLVIPFEL